MFFKNIRNGDNADVEEGKTSQHSVTPASVEIPDGGYGWVVVFANFLLFISTWGSNTSYAIYLADYLRNDTFSGATKLDYGAIGGLTFGAGVLFAHLINFLIGKFGFKQVMFVGMLVQFAGVFIASYATKLWHLYLTQGVLQGFGLALLFMPGFTIIPQWFKRKRVLALGLVSSGSGSGLLFNLGMQKVLERFGYKWALRTQSFICLFLNIIVLILMKSRSKHIKPSYKIYDKVIFQSFGMWMAALYQFLAILGYIAILYCLSSFTQSLGYTPFQGSLVSSMVSLGAFFGRPLFGFLGDKFGPVHMGIISSMLSALFSLALWIPARNLAAAVAFALVAGAICGTIWVIFGALAVRVVGMQRFQMGLALGLVVLSTGSITGPVITISLTTGGAANPKQYQHPAIFVGVCYFVSGIVLIVLRAWLIARDEIALSDGDYLKEGEMDIHISVPPSKVIANLMRIKGPRKT
ncbi:unnamed protein product [Kuraishia capsulata CBS 1993]|uniref:Major facilitator superfamily (MFS) profile domain-containing protein n=1 Tax=Kuraishia capsulata CBS 1993 TaxID=1382522 RepID=W6MK84_9ASCO|nr:uncharacterized protein KUCA_T00002730001 [Kuraishia capsulata CBS 1993]CDK26756.1 unnamed protein product [Kuraishia capsulata CBS 1993]